jgi:hypothetical protein
MTARNAHSRVGAMLQHRMTFWIAAAAGAALTIALTWG